MFLGNIFATLTAPVQFRRDLGWGKAGRSAGTGQGPDRPGRRFAGVLAVLTVLAATAGCTPTTWLAHRMQQAPNTFPTVLGPEPRVYYSFPGHWLTNLPARTVAVGPPAAKLSYRIVEPANYGFHITSTNWQDGARHRYRFDFRAAVPGRTNAFSASPRGTLFLLHGYGVGSTTMLQWALTLAEDGWRCVLVDLRGHGDSTGKKVFFGAYESRDLTQLANALERRGQVTRPYGVLGASYGAGLALKWAGEDARMEHVVAITPYAELQPAVLAIRDGYASWLPRFWVCAAAARLPGLVGVTPGGLDPVRWLAERPVRALFIATDHDPIAPPAAVKRLHAVALPESGYQHLTNGIHETAPFQFDELLPAVRAWLIPPPPAPR